MAEIMSRNGFVILIDDCLENELSLFSWDVHKYGRNCLYASTNIGGKTTYMHRMVIKAPAYNTVDHINRNGLDNRLCNLRLCTHQQNLANRGKQHNNTSGYKGVTWNKNLKKWQAGIKVSQRYKFLGAYETKEDAAEAYKAASIFYFGQFACQ